MHPDDLELELSRTGEAAPETVAHLEGCDECRARRDALRASLAGLSLGSAPVPDEVDHAILDRARARAASVVRHRRGLKVAAALAPVAAAAAIAAFLLLPRAQPAALAGRTVRGAPAAAHDRLDVDGDGRVDILDAFAVARAAREKHADPRFDLDGNGRVDARDARLAARAAVSLGRRG